MPPRPDKDGRKLLVSPGGVNQHRTQRTAYPRRTAKRGGNRHQAAASGTNMSIGDNSEHGDIRFSASLSIYFYFLNRGGH
jgi:hypothetical protein